MQNDRNGNFAQAMRWGNMHPWLMFLKKIPDVGRVQRIWYSFRLFCGYIFKNLLKVVINSYECECGYIFLKQPIYGRLLMNCFSK